MCYKIDKKINIHTFTIINIKKNWRLKLKIICKMHILQIYFAVKKV